MLLPTCCEAGGVGEAGHADLAERAFGTVAEHAADEPAFGDREAGERAWREAVLARHVDAADGVARRYRCRARPLTGAEVEIEHERRFGRDGRWRSWPGRRRAGEIAVAIEDQRAAGQEGVDAGEGLVVFGGGEPAVGGAGAVFGFLDRGEADVERLAERIEDDEVRGGALAVGLLR